jgi:hypothetical protein
VAVNYFNLLPDDDVSEYWEEGEDCREGGLAVNNKKWNMIDL